MKLGWSEDRITRCAELWEQGMSSSEIAKALGGGLSRNAVCGKVHRLKSKGLIDVEKRKPAATKSLVSAVVDCRPPVARPLVPEKPSRHHFVKTETIAPYEIPTRVGCFNEAAGAIKFTELRTGLFKWPLGEAPFLFCGQVTVDRANPDCSYCSGHAAIAYTSRPVKNRSEAALAADKLRAARQTGCGWGKVA